MQQGYIGLYRSVDGYRKSGGYIMNQAIGEQANLLVPQYEPGTT